VSSFRQFTETCEAVAATTKKTEKVQLLAAYLKGLTIEDAARAAIFFTGRPFARIEEKTLSVGGALLWQAVASTTGAEVAKPKLCIEFSGRIATRVASHCVFRASFACGRISPSPKSTPWTG